MTNTPLERALRLISIKGGVLVYSGFGVAVRWKSSNGSYILTEFNRNTRTALCRRGIRPVTVESLFSK